MRDAFRSLRTNHCSPSKPALGSRSFADWLVGNPAPHGLERFSDERERSLAFRSKGRASPRTSRRRERRIRPTEVAESSPWWARLSTRRSAHRRGSERALTAMTCRWRAAASRLPRSCPDAADLGCHSGMQLTCADRVDVGRAFRVQRVAGGDIEASSRARHCDASS